MNWEFIFKTASVVSGVIVGFLFGGWTALLQILLTFVLFDYLSGLTAAYIEGKLNSKVGFIGIAKKVTIFCIVAVSHSIDKMIGMDSVVQNAVICFYLSNESLSFLENAGRIGVPLPKQLKDAIEVLNGKGKDGISK